MMWKGRFSILVLTIAINVQVCIARIGASLEEFVINSVKHNESLFHNFETKFSVIFLDANGIQQKPQTDQEGIISKEEYHYARENNKIYSSNITYWTDGQIHKGINVFNGKSMMLYRQDLQSGLISTNKRFPSPAVPDRFTNLYRNVRDMTMSEFLKASTIKHVQPCQIKGHRGFMVHLVHCDSSTETPLEQKIYFDAERGFVPDMVETYRLDISTNKPVMVAEVLDFTEVAEGIHFPKKARLVSYFKRDEQGNPVFSNDVRCEISEIKVNTDLPEDMFEFVFPEGTTVYDEITDIYYKVGATKKMVSSVEQFTESQFNSNVISETKEIDQKTIESTKNDTQDIRKATRDVLTQKSPVYRHWLFWAVTMSIPIIMLVSYHIINIIKRRN